MAKILKNGRPDMIKQLLTLVQLKLKCSPSAPLVQNNFSFNISRSMVKKNFADGIFGNVYDREAERTTGFSGIRWLTQKLIILGYSFLDAQ